MIFFPSPQSSFDFGPSFMDEVLKALDEKEKQVTENGAAGHGVKGQGSSAPTPAKREMLGSTSSSSGNGPAPGPRAVNLKVCCGFVLSHWLDHGLVFDVSCLSIFDYFIHSVTIFTDCKIVEFLFILFCLWFCLFPNFF